MRAAALALLLLPALVAPADARPGDLDRRFGNDGVARTRSLEAASVVRVEPSGAILAAGGTASPGVVKLSSRGRRDARFGRRGVAVVRRFGEFRPVSVRRDAGGGVAVLASAVGLDTAPVTLLRWNGRGRGVTGTPHPAPFDGPIHAGVGRPDGGAFVVSRDAIRAIAPDGGVDARFAGGTLRLCAPPDACLVSAVAVRPDGRVVVALFDQRSGDDRLLQLTPDGLPDPGFGTNGVQRPRLTVTALHVMRDGTLVVGGRALGGRVQQPRVARLTAQGAPIRGFTRTALARRGFKGQPVSIASDARGRTWIVMSDPYEYVFHPDITGAAIARLTPSGAVYRPFGRRGVARLSPSRGARVHRRARVLALDRRGGLLAAGGEFRGGTRDPEFGCGIREDLCASEVALAIWRLAR